MHTRQKHRTFAWRNTHTSHTRAPTAPRVTIQTRHNIHHIPYTNIHHTSTLQGLKKHTIFNNGCYTTNIPTDPHTITTTDIKTNMRHIHTFIVSRYFATRGNNKILRTPQPHIRSSEELLPASLVAQLRTNKSPFLKSYLHKVDAKSHTSQLCPLCNTSSLQLHPHTHHIATPGFMEDPAGVTALLARWMEKLAGGPQAGTSDSPH